MLITSGIGVMLMKVDLLTRRSFKQSFQTKQLGFRKEAAEQACQPAATVDFGGKMEGVRQMNSKEQWWVRQMNKGRQQSRKGGWQSTSEERNEMMRNSSRDTGALIVFCGITASCSLEQEIQNIIYNEYYNTAPFTIKLFSLKVLNKTEELRRSPSAVFNQETNMMFLKMTKLKHVCG